MKNKVLNITVMLLIFAGIIACGKGKEEENISCATCENKDIIMVLKDEPAYVRAITFPTIYLFDFWGFELETQYSGLHGKIIIPCSKIPNKYKISRLSVKISGSITNCIYSVDNYLPSTDPAEPFTYEYNIFELEYIKLMK